MVSELDSKRIIELLEEIDSKLDKLDKLDSVISYLHFQAFTQLKKVVPKILDTPEKMIVYDACDGESGIREISRRAGIVPMTVSNYIRKFEAYGIVISRLYKNRKCPMKIVDLEDIGIQVSGKEVKKVKEESSESREGVLS
jgi:AAA+ ATPase superfamily predicted ATPase